MAGDGPALKKGPAGSTAGGTVLLLPASYEDLAGPVAAAFERFPLPLKGARVLVKPNMLGPYRPERGVSTHPALVAAVVDRLLAAGARPVVGDNPGARGYGINRQCGEITGIAAASRGCFLNLSEDAVEVTLDSPRTGKVLVSRAVMEADLVINLPKLKTHVQTVFTGGVKNTFGYLVGADKSRMHAIARSSRDFGRLLADIFALRPPDLTIMDAVTAMEGDGPSSGRLRQVGRLIASGDAVAADVVGCRLIGLDPLRVHHLAEAMRRWPDAGRYDSVGPLPLDPIPGYALPISFVHGLKSYLADRILFSFLRKNRLRIVRDACNGCGICRDGCPVGAITISRGFPRIDDQVCIACYCCHELCPRAAVELNPFLRRLLSKGSDREHQPPGGHER